MTPLKRFNIVCASALASLSIVSVAHALTEFNTVIENKAGATYLDSLNQPRTTQSNTVKTTIQAVAAVEIINDQDKFAAAGEQVSFHHTVTNTGNNNDSFTLNITPTGATITGFTIMPDANNDGEPDVGATPIVNGSNIGPLAPNENFNFVIVVDIDAGASPGDTASLAVSVDSVAVAGGTPEVSAGAGSDSNTDNITVSANPIINVTKQISDNAGDSPSTGYRVTLMYTNTSNTDMDINAPGVIIKDILPTGMRFNGGVEWSIPANNSPVTAPGNLSGVSHNFNSQDLVLTTCIAPNASCPTNDIVEFTIDGLEAQDSALVSFLVNIDSGLNAQTLENSALYGFDEDNNGSVSTGAGGEAEKYVTNKVPFEINPVYAVIANAGNCGANDTNCVANDDTGFETVTKVNVSQGSLVKFSNYIWNMGNDTDTFDITYPTDDFPIGTVFLLFKSDGVTPLTDTDSSGTPDTGPIPPSGETCPNGNILSGDGFCGYKVILGAMLPPDTSTGSFSVTKLATSTSDGTKSNTVIDLIANIVPNAVDITNNFKAHTSTNPESNCNSSGSGCGFGTGPESTPVETKTGIPGSTVTFQLFATNKTSPADMYQLTYSGTNFAPNTMPADWEVVFKDTSGNVITSTPTLVKHDSFAFIAEVTIPETEPSGTQSIYFRALSASSGAQDIKHDAIQIDTSGVCLQLSPPNATRNVSTNGSIDYRLELTNATNDTLTNIEITATDSSAAKFNHVIFMDTGNGVLDDGDTVLTGTPAIIASLAPRSTAVLFVKIFANSEASNGDVNTTSFDVSTLCGGSTASVSSSLVTTVVNTNVQIRKLQAADRNCDGAIDTTPPGNAFTADSFNLEPGSCVIYQITATNIGVENAYEVKITDSTPNFTKYRNVGALPTLIPGYAIQDPADQTGGDIVALIGVLASGEEAILEFAIQIDP